MEKKDPASRRPRISAKLKKAIEFHIRHVMTARQACEAADIRAETWQQAMTRPHVQRFMNDMRNELLAEHDQMAKLQPAQARRVLSDILADEQAPPAIRVRAAGIVMREDARRCRKKPEASKQNAGVIYEYIRPDEVGK